MDEWGDTPTTKPHHEHDDLYVWVSVAVFLAILIMLGAWYWQRSSPLFPKAESQEFALEVATTTGSVVFEPPAFEGGSFVKKTVFGSQIRYDLVTSLYTVSLEYPEYWQAHEAIEQTLIAFRASIEKPDLGRRAFKEDEDYIQVSPLTIHAISSDYCMYGWCFLETKSVYTAPNGQWEYLGDSGYCDAGYCATYRHIYKQAQGDRILYVVTYDPVHTIEAGSSAADATRLAFNSIQFKKN